MREILLFGEGRIGGWYSPVAGVGCSKPAGSMVNGLPGDTPGKRKGLEIRRGSGAPRCGDMLPQGMTRWSIPLSAQRANSAVGRALARSLMTGEQSVAAIGERCGRLFGRRWGFVGPLARRYLEAFPGRGRVREVVRFLARDEGFLREQVRHEKTLRVVEWTGEQPEMLRVGAAAGWQVPEIRSESGLAEWLGLEYSQMLWLADRRGLAGKGARAGDVEDRLRHYHYRVVGKEGGGMRLIEAPKARLKALQRKVLAEILERVPAHPAVHGFVKGRSIKSFAGPHVGRAVVLGMDLEDFFPSFRGARVAALFRTMGYPERVADLLGGLVTTCAPSAAWRGVAAGGLREVQALYRQRHLPQGAPSSPAVANLCSYRLDARLQGLAEAAGATYTRYADDLAFSGDEGFARGVERFSVHVAAILLEEGFRVNYRKTRIMRRGVRQYLAGLVTNERLNVPRADFDALKATLTSCVRHGPESQNREGLEAFREHLAGRVGFVESIHPAKGRRLREIFDRIAWG